MNKPARKPRARVTRVAPLGVLALLLATASYAAREKTSPPGGDPAASVSLENPELLSFDELITLSTTAKPDGPLAGRLDALLNRPFVHRETSAAEAPPRRPNGKGEGPILRVGLWNIERGLNLDLIRSAFSSSDEFLSLAAKQAGAGLREKQLVQSQLATLQGVDLLVLNEADWGMKRTEYRDVTRELASALHMQYAYGVEFVEVDPIFDLDTEQIHLPDAQQDQRLQQDLQVDRLRYRGLHGTAILSRYPIENARIVRLPLCYDWYAAEYQAISKLEQGRRWSAQKLFRERMERELRHGGRMALIADISVPDLPTGRATVVAVHLENKCPPACRRRQMQALLVDLRENRNPLVLAGDLNTTSSDNTPTSIRNEIMSRITDYQFWIGQAVSYFHPLGIFRYGLVPLRYFHGYNDPTAFHLPIVWDNRERSLFTTVENFRFSDHRAFDFRGDARRTLPSQSRTLADSNQRQWKGFSPTYSFNRDFAGLVGRFKLDWIFVKPFLEDPRRGGQSYRFAPSFPVTMRELNEAVVDRVSDHAPMTVDLPLTEPSGAVGERH
jgi:endonuclease/exonuclease/phosphatase family metal-dependent hydrolase